MFISTLPKARSFLYSITWAKSYLGIKIGKTPSSLYNLNFTPVISRIINELETWMDLPISLFGRCQLFKMVSFARLLYPLQTIPLLLRHKEVQSLQRTLSKFLWQGRRPRISVHKLFLPRSEGGANLPNIRVYNLSCLLRICLDWILQTSRYSNFDLEAQMVTLYCLPALLHSKLRSIPPHLQHNLLIRDTLIAWREVRQKLSLSPWISQLLPIHGNPSFSPTLSRSTMQAWAHQKLLHFAQLFDPTSGKSRPTSQTLDFFDLPQSHFLSIHQAVQHAASLCPNKLQRFSPSILDTLLEKQSFKISDIYKPLNIHLSKPLQATSVASWSSDLNFPDAVHRIIT